MFDNTVLVLCSDQLLSNEIINKSWKCLVCVNVLTYCISLFLLKYHMSMLHSPLLQMK